MSDATLGFELLSLAPELELGCRGLLMLSETVQPPAYQLDIWPVLSRAHGTAGREAVNDGIPEQWLAPGPLCPSRALCT